MIGLIRLFVWRTRKTNVSDDHLLFSGFAGKLGKQASKETRPPLIWQYNYCCTLNVLRQCVWLAVRNTNNMASGSYSSPVITVLFTLQLVDFETIFLCVEYSFFPRRSSNCNWHWVWWSGCVSVCVLRSSSSFFSPHRSLLVVWLSLFFDWLYCLYRSGRESEWLSLSRLMRLRLSPKLNSGVTLQNVGVVVVCTVYAERNRERGIGV